MTTKFKKIMKGMIMIFILNHNIITPIFGNYLHQIVLNRILIGLEEGYYI